MPTHQKYTHPINVRNNQLEMNPNTVVQNEDYDHKIRAAQIELQRITEEREILEQQKRELEELTLRKRNFLSQQIELTERLSSAITLIDRELFEMREETGHLEQCRVCFTDHLDKIQKQNPEKWTRTDLQEKLEKATYVTDLAADEYEQAANYFQGTRSGAIFGMKTKSSKKRTKSPRESSEFFEQFTNGLAFNLPVILLGAIALLIYFLK